MSCHSAAVCFATLAFVGCLAGSVAGAADVPLPEDAQAKTLTMPVTRHQLDNGLRVVLNEDNSSPTVAVCVTYDVGSRNEQPGRSGFAHLFEHMMFQGSRNVGKTQHFTLITERGGTLNGTTSVDRTNYYELVPSSGLATVLWLEADRMKSLAVTQENFENQRAVVQEEYRMRVSNAAYATGRIRLRELAFQGYWPHEHDTIGSMEDLDNAKLEWIRAFHQSYYGPNNAVLTLSGDFDSKQALALVRQYFGAAKAVDPPPFTPPPLPIQTKPRFVELRDPNAKTPGIYQGWVIPPNRTEEHYALELATVILSYGDSSVLHEKLVRDESLLRDIATYTYDHRGPDLFVLQALLTERAELAVVERRLAEELTALGTIGPTPAQLDKAKQRLQSHLLFGMEGNLSRATQLSNFELFYGDAGLLPGELARYFAVTPQAVRDAVKRYLTPERQSTVTVLPGPANAPPPTAPAKQK
jgi:zinc protease